MVTLGSWRISEWTIVGLLLIIQGAGSGVVKAAWDTNWGLLAVAERWTPVPAWAGFALAVVGLVLAIAGRTTPVVQR